MRRMVGGLMKFPPTAGARAQACARKNGKERGCGMSGKAGMPRKYDSAKKLDAAIERYFNSITRKVPVVDENGQAVRNAAGEEVMRVEYITPPSVISMCLYLGINKRTWANYCDAGKHPEFAAVTERASMRHEAYLVEESIRREKSVQGILFNLQNNYGYRQKAEVEVGEETRRVAADAMSMREKMALICRTAAEIGDVDADGEPGED